MPNTNEMLLKLECFKYDTSLDLDMGYYHIQLSENLCTTILPQRNTIKRVYQQELATHQKFQKQKINDLFQGFECIHA